MKALHSVEEATHTVLCGSVYIRYPETKSRETESTSVGAGTVGGRWGSDWVSLWSDDLLQVMN